MRAIGSIASLVCAGSLLAACAPDAYFEQRILAMGTWVDITVESPDESAASEVIRDVETMLRAYESDYYAWAPGELAELNASIAAGKPARVSPGLAELLIEARRLSLASEGLFDPGIGALVELWGFHTAPGPGAEPPPAEAIASLLRGGPSIAALDIDGLKVRSASSAVKLDLGGVAKGKAIDEIIALLQRRGIRAAMVNAGGDLRVLGQRGGRPWRIGIQHPRSEGIIGTIELTDGEAAFTSGDYERFFERDGRRFHHLLDPTTGQPVTHTRAVTVITADGVSADAAATALLVAGPDRWRRVAAALGVRLVLRVDASGETELTEPMRERLRAGGGTSSDMIARRQPGPASRLRRAAGGHAGTNQSAPRS